MAVVGIAYEKMGSPGELRENKDGFSVTRTFLVRTNNHADGPLIVDAAVGLPQRGNVYASVNESHPYLFCTTRNIRRQSPKSLVWEVSCEYETPKPNEQQGQQQNNERPEFELPVIRVGSSSELRDVVKTTDGNDDPIVNGAGEPFRPHPKKEVYFPTLQITRNEPITTPLGQTQLAYIGKVNSDTFWGLSEAQWRCVEISGEIAMKVLTDGTQIPYVSVNYVFHAKDTWDLEILNSGWNYKSGSNLVAFKTLDGREYEGYLTSAGAATTTPEYLTFEIYERVAYSGLNLPQSFLAAVA